MAISWVAEQNATKTAKAAKPDKLFCGSSVPIAIKASASVHCIASIQPRRRPSQGAAKRSTKGDQRNFSVYAVPTKVSRPISCNDTFCCVAQACKVPPVSASGNPLAKPTSNKGATRRLKYTRLSEGRLLPVESIASSPGSDVIDRQRTAPTRKKLYLSLFFKRRPGNDSKAELGC